MKAFEWRLAAIDSLQDGISVWEELEYLQFDDTRMVSEKYLPTDIGSLTQLQYLSLSSNGLAEIPSSICNLRSLIAFRVNWELQITSLPHCFGELTNLKIIFIDGNLFLVDVPLSIFNLDNLDLLSISVGSVSYQSLMADIDRI